MTASSTIETATSTCPSRCRSAVVHGVGGEAHLVLCDEHQAAVRLDGKERLVVVEQLTRILRSVMVPRERLEEHRRGDDTAVGAA